MAGGVPRAPRKKKKKKTIGKENKKKASMS